VTGTCPGVNARLRPSDERARKSPARIAPSGAKGLSSEGQNDNTQDASLMARTRGVMRKLVGTVNDATGPVPGTDRFRAPTTARPGQQKKKAAEAAFEGWGVSSPQGGNRLTITQLGASGCDQKHTPADKKKPSLNAAAQRRQEKAPLDSRRAGPGRLKTSGALPSHLSLTDSRGHVTCHAAARWILPDD
jgi:hypothetical protein